MCTFVKKAHLILAKPLEILKQYWGYDAFRPAQADIIQAVLDGKDTLALLPTGGGKSICYQIPALCKEGVCIVVSPLIALMKDQINRLKELKIPAAAIYSGMDYQEIDRTFDNAIYGSIKLLYLSPERLKSPMAIERLRKMPVNLIAVDEAHCISQWGYDFRPAYTEIAEIRELLPKVPILALTATATPEVQEDITEKLAFRQNSTRFATSFERDNLSYVVLNEEDKKAKLLDILKNVPGTSIVYARSRALTRELAQWLRGQRISADYYHAGLSVEQRSKKQEWWINNQIRVIVSTNAFGMGIDKAEVRSVVHMDLPDSLEAYFQEAGRAGRDRKRAFAVLLYNPADKIRLEYQFQLQYPTIDFVRRVYQALCNYLQLALGSDPQRSFDFEIGAFCKAFDLQAYEAYGALQTMEKEGWIALSEAFFIPAKIQVLVERAPLYDYMLRHKRFEKVIMAILRTHQGAFHSPVPFFEAKLANLIKIPQAELVKQLLFLAKENIIRYLPAKEAPQLSFLLPIQNSRYLVFAGDRQAELKEWGRKRLDAALEYAEALKCRNQLLLAYFGELDAPPCGKCDFCTGRSRPLKLNDADIETYQMKIAYLLKREPLTLDEIIASFHARHKAIVVQVLEYALDEGFLHRHDQKFHLTPKDDA